MSKDFIKSDFNKSGSTPKSLDQLKGELSDKIIRMAQRQLAVSETQLNNLLSEDAYINYQITDFVTTLLGGNIEYLYMNTDSLEKIADARAYLGATQSVKVCFALRDAMLNIMDDVGAELRS